VSSRNRFADIVQGLSYQLRIFLKIRGMIKRLKLVTKSSFSSPRIVLYARKDLEGSCFPFGQSNVAVSTYPPSDGSSQASLIYHNLFRGVAFGLQSRRGGCWCNKVIVASGGGDTSDLL